MSIAELTKRVRNGEKTKTVKERKGTNKRVKSPISQKRWGGWVAS